MTALKTSVPSLIDIIASETKETVFGTNFVGGVDNDGYQVNYEIANAIRLLGVEEVSFYEAEVYQAEIDEDEKGYLFKVNGKEIFLLWNKDKRRVNELIFEYAIKEYSLQNVIQAFILLDAELNITNLNTKEKLPALITQDKILLGSEEATLLKSVVDGIEAAINQQVLKFYQASEDEYNVQYQREVLTEALIPAVIKENYDGTEISVEESTLESTDEAVTDSEQAEAEETSDLKSQSEVTQVKRGRGRPRKDSGETQNKPKGHVGRPRKYPLAPSTQEEAVPVVPVTHEHKGPDQKTYTEATTPTIPLAPSTQRKLDVVITIEEVMKTNPLIFDDAWVIEKLRSFNMEQKLIDFVLAYREKQRRELTPKQMKEIPNKAKYKGHPEPIELGIVSILTGNNLLLKGETGVGKTTLAKTICAILNYPMYVANGSADSSIETFVGFKKLENGDIVVTSAPLINAMENNGVFYLDEGNAVLPSVLILMHNAFDDERSMYNEFTGELVNAEPDFRFITSMNEEYSGTNELNDATLDRLVAIEMTYMKAEDLQDLLANFDGNYSDFQKDVLKMGDVSRKDILLLGEIAKALQNSVQQGILHPKVASIRNITSILKASRLTTFPKAVKPILYKYSKEDRAAIMGVLENIEALEIRGTNIVNI